MASKKPVTPDLERERSHLLEILAIDPHYFEQKTKSAKQTKDAAGNTGYEEVECLGYNAVLHTLEANVHIKRSFGYLGDLCSPGSTEYVRFFIDYGSGWVDQGVTSFKVHDIPDANDCAGRSEKPLNFVATLEIDPKRNICRFPVLPNVRAILSWQVVPPPIPGWIPPWGNVIDRYVQIDPRPWIFSDLSLIENVKIPKDVLELFAPAALTQEEAKPLELAQLAKIYKDAKVEPHRFGFTSLQTATTAGATALSAVLPSQEWASAGLDLSKAFEALQSGFGNTTYEQVYCLGLDNQRDWAVAFFKIKRPSGFSGGPCTAGSYEYIAFWSDWEDKCEWTYEGRVRVRVHDYAAIPPDGLWYAAVLRVNPGAFRRRCREPRVAHLRAVLSWNTPPSAVDPDDVPFWGNRLDSHVLIRPGRPVDMTPAIDIIGGISVSQISIFGSGRTTPNALFALYGGFADPWVPARTCPFGGRVHVQADVPPAFAALGYKYRIVAFNTVTLATNPVTTSFLTADGQNPPVFRTPDINGWVNFLDPSLNVFNMLAWWDTAGNDLWEIRLEMADSLNNPLGSTVWHRVQLDNTQPVAAISIDGSTCGEFNKGDVINGHFVARDANFGAFTLDTTPNSLSPPDPTPASGTVQTAVAPGDPWSLNTATMKPCGYVVTVRVWDRAIVGSIPGGHNYNEDDLGFCLKPARP